MQPMKAQFLNDEPMLPPGKFAEPGSRSEAVEKAWQTRRGYSEKSDLAKDTGDDAQQQSRMAKNSPNAANHARAMLANGNAYEAHMMASREAEENGDYGEAQRHAEEQEAQEQEHQQEEREGGDRSQMVPRGEVKARPIKEQKMRERRR